MRTLLAALALLAATPAVAAPYKIVGGGDAALFALDLATVKRTGAQATGTIYLLNLEDDADRTAYLASETVADCDGAKTRQLSFVASNARGEVLWSDQAASEWSPAPAGTNGATMLAALCTPKLSVAQVITEPQTPRELLLYYRINRASSDR